jgi:hypothetical protein
MSRAWFVYYGFYALWIAPAVLMAWIAAVMWHRHLQREFPAFFCYAIFTALRTPILFYVFHHSPLAYSLLYWVAEAASAVLGFAAIHEVFHHLFQAREATRRLGLVLFRWTAGLFVLLAVVAAALAYQSDADWLAEAVLSLTQGARLVQCGLLLFLFAFSYFSGLAWRSHVLGIALGFGLFASVQLVSVAMQARLGMANYETWRWVGMGSYCCAVLVWAAYLLPHKREVVAPALAATEVKSWNQALLQLLRG